MAKNYLFAPFKDDDEKIDAFDGLKENISYYIDKNDVDINLVFNPLVLFMGRLESYYDCIITHLKGEKDGLRVRCDELQADITHDAKVCYDVDDEHIKIIDELKKDNKKLNKKLNDCSNVAYVEILERGYKKEIESLQDQLKDAVNDYESLLNSNGVK